MGQGVQLEKIHSVEGTLQQLQDGGELQQSSTFCQTSLTHSCLKQAHPFPSESLLAFLNDRL